MDFDNKTVAGCAILDDFLGADAAEDLLAQIIAAEHRFAASKVRGANQNLRSSLHLPGRVGVDLTGFTSAIIRRADEFAAIVGMKAFEIYDAELSIVAHRDGDYYGTHIDTRTQADSPQPSIRVISCVYYLHRTPKKFSGGELRIHRLGIIPESPFHNMVEAANDRLVIFPSFLPHEVLPVTLLSDRFADSRFSINCWLHRAR